MGKSVDWLDVGVRCGLGRVRDALAGSVRWVTPHPHDPHDPSDAHGGPRYPHESRETAQRGAPHEATGPLTELPPGGRPIGRSELARARQYIEEELRPEDGAMRDPHARVRSLIAVVDDGMKPEGLPPFYRWDRGKWTPVSDHAVRERVREWIEREPLFIGRPGSKHRGTEGLTEWQRFVVERSKLSNIVEALREECSIDVGRSARAWIAAQYGPDLEPVFGRPVWRRTVSGERLAAEGLADPDRLLSVGGAGARGGSRGGARGGYALDIDAWDRGELRAIAMPPRLFNRAVLDVALTLEELGEAHEGGLLEVARQWAEEWFGFLDEAMPADAHREVAKFAGYCLMPEMHQHFGNVMVFHGPSGCGKGTAREVFSRLLRGFVIDTSLEKMTKGPHLAAWKGKLLATMGEARVGRYTDDAVALDTLLGVTGGDPQSIRQLYGNEEAGVYLTTRVLMCCSRMPDLQRASDLERRMVLVDFPGVPAAPDPRLQARLCEEASIKGVLLWALQGRRWLVEDGGFAQPESGLVVRDVFFADTAPVKWAIGEWVQIVDDDESFVSEHDLGVALVAYLHDLGHKHTARPGKLLKDLLPELNRAGWRGQRKRPVVREEDGAAARPRGFVGLRLTDVARQAVRHAEMQAERARGPWRVDTEPELPV